MSNRLEIHLDGSENGLKELEALKNLQSNITSIRFVDNERCEYLHEDYGTDSDSIANEAVETLPNFSGSLEGVVIPDQITELIFDLYTTRSVSYSIIPRYGNLKVLKCCSAMSNQATIDHTTFPEGIEELVFPSYSKFTMDCIPRSVKILDMSSRYDPTIVEFPPEFFPEGLISFSAPGSFNQSLSVLPRGIKSLELSWQFNKAIVPGDIPSTCKYLHFSSGGRTNKFIGVTSLLVPGSIPEGVLVLDLNQGFNQDLAGLLPSTLLKIRIHSEFTHPIKANDLPASLKVLDLTFCSDIKDFIITSDILPPNLKVLRLHNNMKLAEGFTPSIETITVGYNYESNPNEDQELLN